jgi:uncharacterized membrane protein required for colicin V production
LSTVDRILGAVYGLVRGALIAIGIILTLAAFSSTKAVVQSRMAPYLIEASELVAKAAPREFKDRFQRQYEQMKSSWKVAEQRN